MTSFVIKAHEDRALPPAWNTAPDCPFCRIVRGEAPSYILYENDRILAILGLFPCHGAHIDWLTCRIVVGMDTDIMPLRPGHTLVIPKTHISRVSELPDDFAAQCGIAVSKVARAVSGGSFVVLLVARCSCRVKERHVILTMQQAPSRELRATLFFYTPLLRARSWPSYYDQP